MTYKKLTTEKKKLKFEAGEPVEFEFVGAEGETQQGEFGDYRRYLVRVEDSDETLDLTTSSRGLITAFDELAEKKGSLLGQKVRVEKYETGGRMTFKAEYLEA